MQLPPALTSAIAALLEGVSRKDLARRAQTLSDAYRQGRSSSGIAGELDVAAYIAARMPATGISRWGTVAASHDNARRAFDKGAPVLVYPGGDYETFRPSWHGDKIEFGGRKGFIRLALEEGVPIVPVVAVGGQETALFVTRGQRIAELLQLPKLTRVKVFPISLGPPFGVNVLDLPGRIPLPAKITVEVLPPIDLAERFGPDADHEEVYEEVTDEMQQVLSKLQEERTVPIAG